MNNLASFCSHYGEIGVLKGSTFCSAIQHNSLKTAIAIDNFSQFPDVSDNKSDFLKYSGIFSPVNTTVTLIENDCWTNGILDPFPRMDFLLYDGDHGAESQYKACQHFVSSMEDTFLFAVDDYSAWNWVKESTKKGILDSGCRVLFDAELWNGKEGDNDGWHNGFYVAVLQKISP